MVTMSYFRRAGWARISSGWLGIFIAVVAICGFAQECQMAGDMDAGTHSALERTAQQLFQLAGQGDAGKLRQNSIPSVAGNFDSIAAAVLENKPNLAGATATTRGSYLLVASGGATLPRAEFYCGVFNSPDRVSFVISNLPPGRYGVVILDAKGGKQAESVSFVLQEAAGAWKLGGLYFRFTETGGHDGKWYLDQARQFKSKGQLHNAWFYYQEAINLQEPVPFMSTGLLDRIYEEAQAAKPADLPGEHPLQLSAAGKTFTVTKLGTAYFGTNLELEMTYSVADVSNRSAVYNDNLAAIKALVAKYPELREGFSEIVARAVTPSGQDYGTPMATKDVK